MIYRNSAKPSFQSNKESKDAGFYIANKSASNTFCNTSYCNKTTRNYEQLYALKNSSLIKKNICEPSFDKTNLNINLFTKLDLQNVCVIKSNKTETCASSIDPYSLFFLDYTVDPSGVLFGNTECGVNNFENFLVPNIPPITYNTQNTI